MGHGKEIPYKIPDYTIFKVDKDTPKLLQLQEKLAAHGLKDPWIRNEVWRFNEKWWGTTGKQARKMMSGFWIGLAAAIVVSGGTAYFSKGDDHGHGHGNEHGKEH